MKMKLTYRRRRYKIEREDRETLRRISAALDEILAVLSKPRSRVTVIMETAATVITIFGIFGIVDMIKNWTGG